MMLAKKTKVFILTFIFIISSFSFLLYPNVEAQGEQADPFSLLIDLLNTENIDFDDILTQHPYRFVSAWESNDTRTIKGDIDFSLYFSSVMLSKIDCLKFQDKVKVSLHKLKSTETSAKLIDETDFIKLTPELLSERVQNKRIKLTNINVTLNKGDYLLFGIEINQTQKPISKIVENRFENRVIPILRRVSSYLKSREDNESKQIAVLMEMVLENFSRIDLGSKELATLINTFQSSSFYYESKSYPSKVKFSSTQNESFNLYFRDEPNIEITGNIGIIQQIVSETSFFKNINRSKPTGEQNHYWPAVTIDTILDLFSNENLYDEDIILWAALWALKTIKILPPEPENLIELYLKDNHTMDRQKPDGEAIRERLLNDASVNFSGPVFNRNKIINNLSAELYIHYPKLISFRNIQIKASIIDLYQGEKIKEIANEIKSIDNANLFSLISRGPDVPTTFNFNEFKGNYEIEYDHRLGLEVKIENAGLLNLRPINLVYNSDFYTSNIKYVYEETDNIQIGEIEDKYTYAGGSAVFDVKVTSKRDDSVTILFENVTEKGSWSLESVPNTFDIEKDSTKTVKLYINSTAEDASAYDEDVIASLITAAGKTGIDSERVTVRVKKLAVPFDFEPEYPEDIEIKHGEEGVIKLKIKNKNKGYLADSYSINVTSEHGFYSYLTSTGLIPVYNNNPENAAIIELTIIIPKYTDIPSDNVIINIKSIESGKVSSELSKTITIKTNIIQPNILEHAYHLFEQLSEKIGLDDVMGNYGAWLLIGLFGLLILIIIITILIIINRKFMELICLERIKEITPSEKAEFEIELVNPYKTNLTYEVKSECNEDVKKRWDINLSNQSQVVLAPGQTEKIKLVVTPTNYVRKDDWAEIKVIVTNIEKNKSSSIETATIIKDSKVDVSISGVVHWPKMFKKGDRVETSFKLFNKGKVSAENLTIILFVNGEEKNKVEDVTIPRGGYADIEIPWIAEKGKNKIKIIVKQ